MLDWKLILVAVAALALPLVLLWRLSRRTEYTILQYMLWVLAQGVTRFWWRATLPADFPPGTENGAIIVSNHRSSIDPFFLQVICRHPMHWMVAKEYCEHWAFRWFLKTCEVIPVNRGGIDTAATKTAIRYGQEGGLVGMFPEGRINMTEQLLMPIRPGAVVVALRSGRPLLPCYIQGSPYRGTPWSPFLMRARVTVQFGELVEVAPYIDRENDDELVKELMTQVAREIARLAGQPDFEPVFAGRKWKPTDEEVRADMEAQAQRQREANSG